jgi:uncharacterized protein
VIHTFSIDNLNFAVDGNSGSIHVLDDVGYDIVQDTMELPGLDDVIASLNSKYKKTDILEAYREIELLIKGGALFTPESKLQAAAAVRPPYPGIKALCLHVAHDCNLRCEYCFASKGDYHTGRKMMPREVALKATDYLVEHSGKRHTIEIDFFGGEPLLNFETVKEVVAYGRGMERQVGKRFYFTITTNASLLNDERIDFINEHMDNVVISIDGRKEIHDAVRHDAYGRGSYDDIVPLAQKLVAGRNGKSYFVRGTFTKRNLDFSNDVFHLADLGFKEISVEPVVGSGDDLFIKESDIPEILAEYERLAVLYLERLRKGNKFRFYHFNLDLYDGPCLFKRITSCGAGFEYLAVSPQGSIYPCHQFVGQNEFVLGNVFAGIKNAELVGKFENNNILTKKTCSNCWAKLFCSGGCHANAWFTNADMTKPNEISCILQKKRIECAIMIQYVLKAECNVANAI